MDREINEELLYDGFIPDEYDDYGSSTTLLPRSQSVRKGNYTRKSIKEKQKKASKKNKKAKKRNQQVVEEEDNQENRQLDFPQSTRTPQKTLKEINRYLFENGPIIALLSLVTYLFVIVYINLIPSIRPVN